MEEQEKPKRDPLMLPGTPGNKAGNQWKPGQSGNPKGPSKFTTCLWTHICRFMNMTNAQIAHQKRRKDLTISQQSALKIVEKMKDGRKQCNVTMTKYMVDRDEGKPMERVQVEPHDIISDEECEEIRRQLLIHQEGQHETA